MTDGVQELSAIVHNVQYSPTDTFVHFLNLKTQRVLILLFVLGLPCNSVLFCAFVFCCYFINFHQKWSK